MNLEISIRRRCTWVCIYENYNIKFAKVNNIHKIFIKLIVIDNKINKLAKDKYKKWYIYNNIMSMTLCKIYVKHVQDNK